ncbi:MAG TPA: hypothetical protein VNH41_05530 [Steroidobacteraceae bacterium]|nr:hypothetical protein [Steroidobacteraceae bacterium]
MTADAESMAEDCRWPSGPDTEPKQFDPRVEVDGIRARQITPIAPERYQAQ